MAAKRDNASPSVTNNVKVTPCAMKHQQEWQTWGKKAKSDFITTNDKGWLRIIMRDKAWSGVTKRYKHKPYIKNIDKES
jgi:hypothetical protein